MMFLFLDVKVNKKDLWFSVNISCWKLFFSLNLICCFYILGFFVGFLEIIIFLKIKG